MTDSEEFEGRTPERRSADEFGGRSLRDTLHLRQQLDRCIDAWIADITTTSADLPQQIQKRYQERLSEAGDRFDRSAEGLRCALDQVDERMRENAIELEEARRQMGESRLLDEERSKIERQLREVHNRFESAFGNAPIGMGLIDTNGEWLQVNDALCRITGYTRDELRAVTPLALTHPDDQERDVEYQQQLVKGEIPSYQIEKRYHHACGDYVWILATVSVVRNDAGEVLHLISQIQDISERKRLEGHFEYLAAHDVLTGLFNRRRFEEELSQEVERSRRYGSPGAVLIVDLDNFKEVNDAFGHKAGDDLLASVAQTLKHRIRQTDVLARVGGDEFALLLCHADAGRAEIVAQEIVKALGHQTAVLADQLIRITASVGVALFKGLTDMEVLAYADAATYEAKEAGRNRYAIYAPGEDHKRRVPARLAQADRVRRAIEEERLLLYCQPILSLASNQVTQYEALVRVNESGVPLPPSAFLYIAERFGLIQAIDTWVVRQAIALIAKHARAGRTLVLDVNISSKSIGDPELVNAIEEGLANAAVDPSSLIFELTETSAITNIEDAKLFADRLHRFGCRFALDDFGAGFGSFYYVKNLPFDYLKIDGDFIRGLTASAVDQLVVTAMVRIAQGMGKQTVAEFVTDESTVQLLRTIGVDYAQGYHVGLPRPAAETLRLPTQ